MRKMASTKSKLYLHQNTIKAVAMIILLIIVIAFLLSFFSMQSKASDLSNDTTYYKYYKSYVVSENDTLWDLAVEYCNADLQTYSDYVDEVIDCNNLLSDTIYEDDYLIIPYYSNVIM